MNLRLEEYEVYIDVEVKLENVDSILGLEFITIFCNNIVFMELQGVLVIRGFVFCGFAIRVFLKPWKCP